MQSLLLDYDADTDTLEARFAGGEDGVETGIALNDRITVYTDDATGAVSSLRIQEFSRILRVSETELAGLHGLADTEVDAILSLMAVSPASHFFDVTDAEALIARVRAPNLQALIESGP